MNFICFSRLSARAAALSFLAGTAACGSLSGETGSDSRLATVHGTIVQVASTALAPDDLSTALVWYKPVGETGHSVAVSTKVSATFPAAFSIDITEPPPADMMVDLASLIGSSTPTGVHVAGGILVAYEDLNHNGQLDLVREGAAGYVDQIVGSSLANAVIYLDNPVPPGFSGLAFPVPAADGSVPQPGYNFMFVLGNVCASGDGGAAECSSSVTWKPIGTPITLSLGDASPEEQAEMNLLMCGENAQTTRSSVDSCSGGALCIEPLSAFAGPLPAATDPNLICESPTTFAYYEDCTTTQTVCAVTSACNRVTVSLAPPGGPVVAAPSDWPCAVQSSP